MCLQNGLISLLSLTDQLLQLKMYTVLLSILKLRISDRRGDTSVHFKLCLSLKNRNIVTSVWKPNSPPPPEDSPRPRDKARTGFRAPVGIYGTASWTGWQ